MFFKKKKVLTQNRTAIYLFSSPTSGGYSSSGPEARISQRLMFSRKKGLWSCLSLIIVTTKKKRSSPRIDLVFPTFCPSFIMISEKHMQQTETICAIFKGAAKIEGILKKGGPEANASFASPNIYTVPNSRCSLKKKVSTQNQAAICQFLFPNSLICQLHVQ